MHPRLPVIAIVGRTSVGKSTLFNRLIEEQKSLISDTPGTTRDRQEGICLWRGVVVKVIDTGGVDDASTDIPMERQIAEQAARAQAQADLVLFIVDLATGPLPQEQAMADRLKRSRKPVIVVGNKAETPVHRAAAASPEWRLKGLPAPLPISALRGTGVGDLLDLVYTTLTRNGTPPVEAYEARPIRVAVIGKPNAGKSSLLNALVGEERFIANPAAHTTREPVDTLVTVNEHDYLFIDTAGIRKIGKIHRKGGLEEMGVERTVHVLKRSDVALLVLDTSQPLGNQERVLAGLAEEARVGVIVIANKWDLIAGKSTASIGEYTDYIHDTIPFLRWAPILFTSAKTGQRVDRVFSLVQDIQAARHRRLTDDEVKAFLKRAVMRHLPSKGKGPKPPKVLGMRQTEVTPPRFVVTIQAKRTDVIHPSYLRYLENRLHEEFGFQGTPVIVNARLPTVRAK
ncbi:ribosome biogenesis GTPase Der [Candidatus Uhrbacteria bacterium]|nr:ribosome biogenesis GTPase Der [Candidatus Uhrbacteria bacterium]